MLIGTCISEFYGNMQHYILFLFTGQEWAEWGVTQLQLATIDFNNAPSQAMLQRGVGFIEKMNRNDNSVYVHCKAGRGRSTTLVACYLMKVESTIIILFYELLRARVNRGIHICRSMPFWGANPSIHQYFCSNLKPQPHLETEV